MERRDKREMAKGGGAGVRSEGEEGGGGGCRCIILVPQGQDKETTTTTWSDVGLGDEAAASRGWCKGLLMSPLSFAVLRRATRGRLLVTLTFRV